MPPADPTTLYRFFAADGALLYIGIAGNPGRRFSQHAKDKPWWHHVDHSTMEHFPGRQEAMEAERHAIETERPRYNIVHNRDGRGSASIAVICGMCSSPIAPGEGYFQVHRVRAEHMMVNARVRASDDLDLVDTRPLVPSLSDALDRIELRCHWEGMHTWCDPSPGEAAHLWWVGVDQVSTWPGLVAFTASAFTQWWIDATDLHTVLAALTSRQPGPLQQAEGVS